ncbi:acetyltransferase EpsM [Alkalibacillus filiformis]|uniref:Acetyltransferase EpsM n=1 Tax=Alkalibacillus filiformis TaxID=200990 RepID=A0ABU0DWC0_9BACI|nr:acetyltransferase [Alkalibacillus filiformis]MDQ0352769.1 acetyltransferase EpsM [Alkalibacillus filiformis]
MNKNKLVIIGAGDLGKVVLDTVLQANTYELKNIVFLDDVVERDTEFLGAKVVGGLDEANKFKSHGYKFIIAISNNKIRKKIADELTLPYINVIHPNATISANSSYGVGNIILANSTIDPDVKINNLVIINKNSSIGHDSVLEDYTQVSPGCALGGYTYLKESVFLGLGANTLPKVNIGECTTVGAGSTVTKDIESNVVAIGSPCKKVKSIGV